MNHFKIRNKASYVETKDLVKIWYNQMRKLFFGGNWKSNNTLGKTQKLVGSLIDKLEFDPAHAGTYTSIKML